MSLAFTKGHGTGNDFILVLDEHGQIEISAEQVALMCDRHFGIGADGLIRVTPTAERVKMGTHSLVRPACIFWALTQLRWQIAQHQKLEAEIEASLSQQVYSNDSITTS